MWNPLVIKLLCLCSLTYAVPLGLKKNMAIVQEQEDPMLMLAENEEARPEMMISRLNLPSNATSIRADITDGFSCNNKTYGYYADVENECQIFHVCLPVTYADGKENTFRWSFICPEETVFSQEYFTCMRSEDMSIDCEESSKFYDLNRNFGMIEAEEQPAMPEEEMNMEEMSRQPTSEEMESVSPAKKPAVQFQNSNKKKTQANRVALEAQRKKVQPLRKMPQPLEYTTSAKPIVDKVPAYEREEEKTTVKYQRFTKRPASNIVEQPKPEVEVTKPEKQIIRQDLYAQKRKRPQVFNPTKIETAGQIDLGSKPYLKTDFALQKKPELVISDQAEAQASQIAEVSVKPQIRPTEDAKPVEAETSQLFPMKKIKPVFVSNTSEEKLSSENAPLPEYFPSRVGVVEDPIKDLDEPVMDVASSKKDTKPIKENVKVVKDEEKEIKNKNTSEQDSSTMILKKSEKPTDSEILVEAEKIQPMLETMQVQLNEPEAVQNDLKSVEILKESSAPAPKPPKDMETVLVSNNSEVLKSDIKFNKPSDHSSSTVEIVEKPEEPEVLPKIEDSDPTKEEVKTNTNEPSQNVVRKPDVLEKVEPLIEELKKNIEAKAPLKEEALLKKKEPVETSSTVEKENLKEEILESPTPVLVETPAAPPLLVDMSTNLLEKQTAAAPTKKIEMSDSETNEKSENLGETKIPTAIVENKPEKPTEVLEHQNLNEQNPMKMPLEKSSEVIKSEETVQPPRIDEKDVQLSPAEPSEETTFDEKNVQTSPTEPDDAQTLILDFISSLVNSENSNFEAQNSKLEAIPSDSIPLDSIPEATILESKPTESKAEEQSKPSEEENEQMYQIPVQVIETPESEIPVPVPVEAQPKLPVSIDDVVELVKESLDNPAKKENLVQKASAEEPLPESGEVKPIYHRYVELDSNLLKSEALTASDEDEPVVQSTNKEPVLLEKEQSPPVKELSKASELKSKPEQLASQSTSGSHPEIQSDPVEIKAQESLPLVQSLPAEKVQPFPDENQSSDQLALEPISEPLPQVGLLPAEIKISDRLAMSRSLNSFKMDPRKRRFLFRSDAS